MNGKWGSETGGSWTAISKAPWLKAIELYGKGDCWEGGGLFISKNTYWLNDRYFTPSKTLKQSSEINRDDKYIPEGSFGAECTGVYYRRLMRDGWKLVNKAGAELDSFTLFEKPMPKSWILRKIAHEQTGSPIGKGCYWDEHELINDQSGLHITQKDWEWAELDQECIVWAEKGCLYRAEIQSTTQLGQTRLLFDFNPFQFEEIIAPY